MVSSARSIRTGRDTHDVFVELVHERDRAGLVVAVRSAESLERRGAEVVVELGLVAEEVLDAIKVPPARSGQKNFSSGDNDERTNALRAAM